MFKVDIFFCFFTNKNNTLVFFRELIIFFGFLIFARISISMDFIIIIDVPLNIYKGGRLQVQPPHEQNYISERRESENGWSKYSPIGKTCPDSLRYKQERTTMLSLSALQPRTISIFFACTTCVNRASITHPLKFERSDHFHLERIPV